jgi:hypothetical protein
MRTGGWADSREGARASWKRIRALLQEVHRDRKRVFIERARGF